MKNKDLSEKGFTLIEMVMSLVLLGIMGTVTAFGATRVVEAFIFTRANASTAQQGHIALSRLTKEFNAIYSVNASATNGNTIEFTYFSYLDGVKGTDTVSWSGAGTPLLLDNDILVDNVSNFELMYFDTYTSIGTSTWYDTHTVIGITLTLTGASGIESVITTRVVPRSLGGFF